MTEDEKASTDLKLLDDLVAADNYDVLEVFIKPFPPKSWPINKLLQGAILLRKPQSFTVLLDHGVDVNGHYSLPGRRGFSMLETAAAIFEYDHHFFNTLLARGADISKTKDQGTEVIIELIMHQNADTPIATLLEAYPHLIPIPNINNRSIPLLNRTVMYGSPKSVTAIVKVAKAIINMPDWLMSWATQFRDK
jgi:hypothetical protein